jgi:hypothetical protein
MFTNTDGTVYSNAATLVVSDPASISVFTYNNTPVCTTSGIITVSLNGSGKFQDGNIYCSSCRYFYKWSHW